MQDNNRRIAKNAVSLYVRMLIQLLVGLYTSRVILETLGVSDYGIYNVIGGFVTLFVFIQGSLMQATQRFLNFELGRRDTKKVNEVFCMSLNIYAIFSLMLLLALGIIGCFFLKDFLNIPLERWNAAYWVYTCSILTLIVQIMSTPYNALIIAHEDITTFAYIDLLSSFLTLLAIIFLKYSQVPDRLVAYSVFVFGITLFIRFLYSQFCKKKYIESTYKFEWKNKTFKELISFSGWVTLSAASEMLKRQGITILMNLTFGVVVNAALAIANHVSGFINKFAMNLQTAYIPQLVKSYAEGNIGRTTHIIYSGAKMCCILILIFSIPLCIEADYIVKIWLKNPPQYTSLLIWLILTEIIIKSLTYSMNSAIRATGKIRKYEITLNIIQFISFLVIVLATLYWKNICTAFIVQILFTLVVDIYMISYCAKVIGFSARHYFKQVCLRVFVMVLFVLPIPLLLHYNMQVGFVRLILVCISDLFVMYCCLYCFVLTKQELNVVKAQFQRILHVKSNE